MVHLRQHFLLPGEGEGEGEGEEGGTLVSPVNLGEGGTELTQLT